ncbi:MAG TPA: CotH kinase family protein [Roseivirga sp.]
MKLSFNKFSFFSLIILSLIVSCAKDKGPEVPDDMDFGPEGSSIPYVVIDTKGNNVVDEPKVPANMFIFKDQQIHFSSSIGIEFRGSTSQRLFPKKSYGIELWDENGEDYSEDIFEMGKEEDWILYGPYSDKTLLRNVLIYDLSNEIGQYAPETQIVEVKMNGSYAGVFIFLEKIKRDGDRVNIESLQPTMTASSVISGGYILKIDKTSGDTNNPDWAGDSQYTSKLGFRSNYGAYGNRLTYAPYGGKVGEETYFLYEYPSDVEINNEQKNYIQQYISDFEDALINVDYTTSPRAYEAYIDVPSFVDFFILNELSANPDAYRLSTFMHKDRDQKLKMGPIWDFNLAFGNDGRSSPQGWIYRYNESNPNDLWLVHFWWNKLLMDPQFKAQVKARWNQLRASVLQTTAINQKIDDWVLYLQENKGVDRNYERWDVMGEALPFNSFVGATYEEEIDYVKGWIQDRISWMDTEISGW